MDHRKIFRYKEFPVYRKLRAVRKRIRNFLNTLPNSETRRLADQGMRAINSSCLNLAEGANKPTDKEFAQFVNRSLISTEEVESVLDMFLNDGYLSETLYQELSTEIKQVAEDLLKFERSLRKISKS